MDLDGFESDKLDKEILQAEVAKYDDKVSFGLIELDNSETLKAFSEGERRTVTIEDARAGLPRCVMVDGDRQILYWGNFHI